MTKKYKNNIINNYKILDSYYVHDGKQNHTTVIAECLECGEIVERPLSSLRRHKACSCKNKNRTGRNIIDYSGKKYSRLTVLKYLCSKKYYGALWQCKCECGNIVEVYARDLKTGNVRSCGCLKEEQLEKALEKAHVIQDEKYLKSGTYIPSLYRKINSNNTTGVTGVTKRNNRYIASIAISKKNYHIGTYQTLSEASMVRKEAEKQIYDPILKAYENGKEYKLSENEIIEIIESIK